MSDRTTHMLDELDAMADALSQLDWAAFDEAERRFETAREERPGD